MWKRKKEVGDRDNTIRHVCQFARVGVGTIQVWGKIKYCPICGDKIEDNNKQPDCGIE
jgi:hypothetical protein